MFQFPASWPHQSIQRSTCIAYRFANQFEPKCIWLSHLVVNCKIIRAHWFSPFHLILIQKVQALLCQVVCSFSFLLRLPCARSAKNWNELGEIGDVLILIQQKIFVVCLQSWWLLFARLYGWTTTPPSPLLLVPSETEWCGSSRSCSVDLIVVDWMMLHVARVKEVHYGGRRGECYCRSYRRFAGAIISGSILSALAVEAVRGCQNRDCIFGFQSLA
jgi:hypothetical protein